MRVNRLRYAVIPLVAAGWLVAAGTAQAGTAEGVTVPNAVLTAGTGNQIVDITIGAGSAVVGSSLQLTPSTEDGYVVGITAAGAGGSCTAFNSAAWSCEPGGAGWHAGSIQLTVSTAKATPCNSSGICEIPPLTLQIVGDGTPVDVDGSIFVKAAAQPSRPPASTAPKPKPKPSQSSASSITKPMAHAGQSTPSKPTASAVPSGTPSTVAASSSSASASTSAAGAGASAPAASSLPAVVDAADASSSSSASWVFGGLAVAVILLAGGFVGLRRRASRQRD